MDEKPPEKPKNNNGWTPERRAKQAETIRKHRPWEKSTGPRTAEGRAKIAARQTKHGGYGKDMQITRELLRAHCDFMKAWALLQLVEAARRRDKVHKDAP